MPNATDLIADLYTTRAILQERVKNGLSNNIALFYSNILKDIEKTIKQYDNIVPSNVNKLIKEIRENISESYPIIKNDLFDFADTEAGWVSGAINGAVSVDLMRNVLRNSTVANIVNTSLLNTGNEAHPIKAWFESIDRSILFDIEGAIKLGMVTGETNAQIYQRVLNITNTNITHAQNLTRTAISVISNEVRQRTYEDNEDVIKGYERFEKLDSRTCILCSSSDGKFYNIDDKKPPATQHINCRGTYLPVLKSWEDLGIKGIDEAPKGTRASMDGQVSSGITFDDWLKSKDKSFIEDYLGKGRAELYLNKKLTLSDLITNKGNVLTIKELKQKYN